MASRTSLETSESEKAITPDEAVPPNDFDTSDATAGNGADAAVVRDAVEGGDPEKPKPIIFDPRENPDGGKQAYLCLIGGFCVLFCSFGWINCEYTSVLQRGR